MTVRQFRKKIRKKQIEIWDENTDFQDILNSVTSATFFFPIAYLGNKVISLSFCCTNVWSILFFLILQGDLRLEDVGLRYPQASQEQASSHLAGERCEELRCALEREGSMQQSNSSDVVTRFNHVSGLQ